MKKLLFIILIFPYIAMAEKKTEIKTEKNIKENIDLKKEAYFAAGCFWCIESDFDKIEGVISTTSGYTGGEIENPTYTQVSSGSTKHIEALKVEYDPKKTNYKELLKHFWKNVDPFDSRGQFCDKGYQYSGAIFYQDDNQKKLAEESLLMNQKLFKEKIVTSITALKKFYTAEKYHQDYHNKNPFRYKFYRASCGRDKRLEKIQKLKKPKEE